MQKVRWRGGHKEAPHFCGAGESEAVEKREAPPKDSPFTPPQECGGSLKEALEQAILTHLVALHWPATLSGHFGKKNARRVQRIAEILETLQGLGKL